MHRQALKAAMAAMIAGLIAAPLATPVLAQAAATTPAAASPVDPALLQQGAALYTTNCAQCHQAGGGGTPPSFPALAGNAHLADLSVIVGNIHNGKNPMPAFPNLTADEIAALATYVRNSWGNAFGGATSDDVASIIGSTGAPATAAGAGQSIWDGVFTKEQADRGAIVMSGTCAKCHGTKLNGAGQPDQPPSPAIARAGFLHKWDGQSVQALFAYLKAQMPKDNPGQLTDQQYADSIADILAVSGLPAGTNELPADPAALAGVVIREKAL